MTKKPSNYKIYDIKSLIHSVVFTYHPERTETFKFHYLDMKQTNNSFGLNQIGLQKGSVVNITVCIKQLSQRLTPRIIPPFAYSKQKLEHLKKKYFQ